MFVSVSLNLDTGEILVDSIYTFHSVINVLTNYISDLGITNDPGSSVC